MAWITVGELEGEPYMVNTKHITRYYAVKVDDKISTILRILEGDRVSEQECLSIAPTEIRKRIKAAEKTEAQELAERLEDKGF